ncbi:MAG: hypothetical protein F6K36_25265 [Symploca sp. SIO3C6]|uniref:Lipoprotein n=1 Tax=Symploca sp. SIO1C4 TaxID=2607765 RepID=A0A6B3NE88_9CYAN|nr:hypothetical protein [Symploca sp. SIO3C6]NER28444.1 hypothetical protein [Symploca sp. SIO1C4]NET06350.1 hypothetical protein [Symploca sp. SIO2B6]NET51309.1 hypothetical protein [Merismopedia sp. SIO2A8]
MPKAARMIVSAVLMTLVMAWLTACGTNTPTLGLAPSKQLVQKAVALQIDQTQQQLTYSLGSTPPKLEIIQVRLKQVEPLLIDNLPAYHFRGTYTLKIKLPQQQVIQRQNPFDVYLQRQKEGKTWRLARLQSTEQGRQASWRTYLINLDKIL